MQITLLFLACLVADGGSQVHLFAGRLEHAPVGAEEDAQSTPASHLHDGQCGVTLLTFWQTIIDVSLL
jgi:hypothetical protein